MEKKENDNKMSKIRKRLFFIMQYEKHPETGEKLIDLEQIKDGLNHKTIKKYAYILHDKDCNENGELKPRHWHIAIACNTAVSVTSVANWFGVPVQYVNFPQGRNAFLDCVLYLIHESEKEQAKGKHRYDDEEVVANFDWRTQVDNLFIKRLEGEEDDAKKILYRKVLYEGKTLRSCFEDSKKNGDTLYSSCSEKLKKLRLDYFKNTDSDLLMPSTRQNYYVCGSGGAGKDLLSKALARSLFSDLDNPKSDNDIFFMVGSNGAGFLGYDGQPVIIYSDVRAVDLIRLFGNPGSLYANFDTHPQAGDVNIKYGSVKLVNSVNIVNSPQDYNEFLDGLAGEYRDKNGIFHEAEDKTQVRRRFQTLLPIDKSYCEVLVNLGWLDEGSYMEYKNLGRFKLEAKRLGKRLNKYKNDYLAEYGEIEGLDMYRQKRLELSQKITKKPREAYELVESFDSEDDVSLDDDFEELLGLDDDEIAEYQKNNVNFDESFKFSDRDYYILESQLNRVLKDIDNWNKELSDIRNFRINLKKLGKENNILDKGFMETDLFTGSFGDYAETFAKTREKIRVLIRNINLANDEIDRLSELLYNFGKDLK